MLSFYRAIPQSESRLSAFLTEIIAPFSHNVKQMVYGDVGRMMGTVGCFQ